LIVPFLRRKDWHFLAKRALLCVKDDELSDRPRSATSPTGPRVVRRGCRIIRRVLCGNRHATGNHHRISVGAARPAGLRPEPTSSPAAATSAATIAAKMSKQAALIDLLKRPAGATLAILVKASGWQQHSVRGFLTGVVRKKLGLELVSIVEADQRIYRIVAANQA